jgi:formate dehydrogenase maturation protein FdhE
MSAPPFEIAAMQEDYVKHPYFCPFCGSNEIDASKTDAFENLMYQWVRCDSCGTEWHDVYELIGFEQVKEL